MRDERRNRCFAVANEGWAEFPSVNGSTHLNVSLRQFDNVKQLKHKVNVMWQQMPKIADIWIVECVYNLLTHPKHKTNSFWFASFRGGKQRDDKFHRKFSLFSLSPSSALVNTVEWVVWGGVDVCKRVPHHHLLCDYTRCFGTDHIDSYSASIRRFCAVDVDDHERWRRRRNAEQSSTEFER